MVETIASPDGPSSSGCVTSRTQSRVRAARGSRMRRAISAVGLLLAAGSNAQTVSEALGQRVQSRAAETAANPFLSFLPREVEPDFEAWRRFVADVGALRARRLGRAPQSLVPHLEQEAVGAVGFNDFVVSAEALPRRGDSVGWRIHGRLERPPLDLALLGDVGGSTADGLDLSASLAGGERLFTSTWLGDGSYGSAGTGSGDFDVYCFDGLAGETLLASVRTPAQGEPGAGLDPFLALFDGAGMVVGFEDEIIEGGFFVSTDARMEKRLPLDDRYCLFVGGSRFDGTVLPADPADASSGSGVVSEGAYRLEIAVDPPDRFGRDLYAFAVEAGDVVGATLRDGPPLRIGLLAESGADLVASSFDLSGLYPLASPLPGGGSATIAYVMPTAQTVVLKVEAASAFSSGDYEVELAIFRPPHHATRGATRPRVQRVILEFDGGVVDRSAFFGPGLIDPEPVTLSPLSAFLGNWALSGGDLEPLIERIVAITQEELSMRVAQQGSNGDWRRSGALGEFAVEVLGGPGIVAQPGDVRLVIGGTIDELRLQTIGIAETIDPGNFENTKLAVVLLDLLSAPAANPNSLNGVDRAAEASKIELIATAIGRIAAHEAGHLFGNFHTERDVGPTTIMDSGGRLDRLLGLGLDGVFGTGDDVDVYLGLDEYARREPFRGVEPTLDTISHGLPVGPGSRIRVEPARLDFASVPVGSSAVRQLEIRNEGSRVETVRPGGSGGCGACSFSLSTTSLVLAPGERRIVDVTFSPFASGPARLSVPIEVDGDARLDVRVVELTGVGGSSALEGRPTMPVFAPILYPGPLASSARVRFRNVGGVALQPALRLIGPHADRFRIGATTRGLDEDLAPGEELAFDVVFEPGGTVGQATASLWLMDALRAAPPQEILLRARSDGPDLALEPRPYVFGALRADGASGRRSFRIENRGTRALRVDSVALSAATPEVFQLTPPSVPRSVAPGDTLFAPVVFTPNDAVIYYGELIVETNDPDEPLAVVEMAGVGLLPMIEVWPPAVRLDAVAPGQTVDGIVLRVANVGGATLNGTLELVDPSGGWTVTPPPGDLRLRPETETEFELRFSAPTARGVTVSDAVLVIRSDDRERPEVRVRLIVGSVLEIPVGGAVGSMLLAIVLGLVALHRLRA